MDAICAFVLRFGRGINDLITLCSAGVSRSPVVAAGIHAGLRQDESEAFDGPAYQQNPYAYRLAREAFERGVCCKKTAEQST